jgi:hypothetical protein
MVNLVMADKALARLQESYTRMGGSVANILETTIGSCFVLK